MFFSSRTRLILISALLCVVVALMFVLSGTRFLKGSLLDDRVLTLADISPKDGTLSVKEMRKVIVAEIAAITTNAANYQAAYDLNNSGAVDHADLVLLGQSLRAFLGAVCRNGVVEAGEQCDDNNASNNDFCTNVCKNAACGDTFVQGAEQCDDGNQINTDSCSNSCIAARCGDGTIQSGEQCDDGNLINEDFCTGICKLAACGDGFKQGAEACDDGNSVDTDACRNSCTLPVCGDGIVQGSEQCDDGNTSQTDSCMNTCTIPVSDTSIEQFCAINNVAGSLNGVSESVFSYPSSITHQGEAYAGAGVISGLKTAGTIYRSVRQNNVGRWLKEAQFPAVSSSSYANIRFFSTANHLVAALEPSGTGSMLLERQQNGQWTNISFSTPIALRIGSIVEKDGKLHLNSLNNGMVYRYDGSRVWTPIATAIPTLKDIATLSNTLYAISVSNLYRYDGVSWVNVPIQGLPFANATTFATVFQMVTLGDSLFVSGVDGDMQKSMVFTFNPIALFTPATKMTVGNPPTGMSQLTLHAAGNSLVAGAYSSPTQFSTFRYVPLSNTFTIMSTVSYSQGKSFNNALVTLQSGSPPGSWYISCSKTATCGDSIRDQSEQCDDGNTNDTDVCRNNCTFTACGNGIVNAGESCDDSNINSGDGCNAVCSIESGFTCATGNPSVCTHTPVCGDGIVEGNEQCDGGSSCTSSCTVIPKCGDGIVNQATEQCDDGNNNEADFCTSLCESRTPLPYAYCNESSTVACYNGRTPLCPTSLPNLQCKFGSASCCDSRRCVQMMNLCEGTPPPNPPAYAYCSIGSTQHFCSDGSVASCPSSSPISLCYENTIDGNNLTHDRPVCCTSTLCAEQPTCGN